MNNAKVDLFKCPTAEIWWIRRGDVKVGEVRRMLDGYHVSVFGADERCYATQREAFKAAKQWAASLKPLVVELIGAMEKLNPEGQRLLLIEAREVVRRFPKLPPAKVIAFPIKL
jgi:hypothetical protein